MANEMDNVISLSIGEPDFTTPWHVREEGIRSLEDGKTWYSPNRGFIELRQEISRWLKRHYHVNYNDKDESFVTVGGSEAIALCLRSLISPGDEVLIPEPSFVCEVPLTEMAGGVPVVLETKAEDRFRITPEALRAKITPKTKLLILPYPNNPTGAVMRREHLEAIAEVVRENDLMVLSDEIYSALTYGCLLYTSISSRFKSMPTKWLTCSISRVYCSTSCCAWVRSFCRSPREVAMRRT